MATYVPPTRVENPHLPFGDQRKAPFYGKDILIGQAVLQLRPGIYLCGSS
jgi:hypothetical protein